MAISSSFLIALEVLADFDVGVFLYAAFIFIDELEIRRQHPSVGGWPTFTFCVKVGRKRRRRQMDNPYAGLREFPPLQKP